MNEYHGDEPELEAKENQKKLDVRNNFDSTKFHNGGYTPEQSLTQRIKKFLNNWMGK